MRWCRRSLAVATACAAASARAAPSALCTAAPSSDLAANAAEAAPSALCTAAPSPDLAANAAAEDYSSCWQMSLLQTDTASIVNAASAVNTQTLGGRSHRALPQRTHVLEVASPASRSRPAAAAAVVVPTSPQPPPPGLATAA